MNFTGYMDNQVVTNKEKGKVICLFDFDGTIKKEPDVIPYLKDTVTILLAALTSKFDLTSEQEIARYIDKHCVNSKFIDATKIKQLLDEANLSDEKIKADALSRVLHANERLSYFPDLKSISSFTPYQKDDGSFRIAMAMEDFLGLDSKSRGNPAHKLFVGVMDTMWRNPELLETHDYALEFLSALKSKNVMTGIVTNKPVEKFESLANARPDVMRHFDAFGSVGMKNKYGVAARNKPETDIHHLVLSQLQEKFGEFSKDEPLTIYMVGDSLSADILSGRYLEGELKNVYPNLTFKTIYINAEANLSKEARHNLIENFHYNSDRIKPSADIVIQRYDDPQLEKEFGLGKAWKHAPSKSAETWVGKEHEAAAKQAVNSQKVAI